jgi:hypothetical protein
VVLLTPFLLVRSAGCDNCLVVIITILLIITDYAIPAEDLLGDDGAPHLPFLTCMPASLACCGRAGRQVLLLMTILGDQHNRSCCS